MTALRMPLAEPRVSVLATAEEAYLVGSKLYVNSSWWGCIDAGLVRKLLSDFGLDLDGGINVSFDGPYTVYQQREDA